MSCFTCFLILLTHVYMYFLPFLLSYLYFFLLFSSLIHWSEFSSSYSRLSQYNLATNTFTPLISSPSSRKRREVDPSTIQPTSGIVWDVVTERVWICDNSTGNIVSCNGSVTPLSCTVEVNRSALMDNSDTGGWWLLW